VLVSAVCVGGEKKDIVEERMLVDTGVGVGDGRMSPSVLARFGSLLEVCEEIFAVIPGFASVENAEEYCGDDTPLAAFRLVSVGSVCPFPGLMLSK